MTSLTTAATQPSDTSFAQVLTSGFGKFRVLLWRPEGISFFGVYFFSRLGVSASHCAHPCPCVPVGLARNPLPSPQLLTLRAPSIVPPIRCVTLALSPLSFPQLLTLRVLSVVPPYKKSRFLRSAESHCVATEAQAPLLAPSAVVPVSCITHEAFRLGIEPAFVPAESLALQLLAKDSLEHSDILELWSRIPVCKRLKPPQKQALNQSYLVLGLSPRLPETFTAPTFPLQHTVRVLTLFVKQHFPELRYTTLSFQTNCNKGPHRDLNNADAPAFLTCLSQQSGGDLWIHSPLGSHTVYHEGQVLRGVVAPIRHSPIMFRSRSLIHCCTPWRSGPRTILTAFTTLNIRNAPDCLRHAALEHLNLPFPTPEDLAAWSEQAKAKAKHIPKPADPNQSSILDYVQTSARTQGHRRDRS